MAETDEGRSVPRLCPMGSPAECTAPGRVATLESTVELALQSSARRGSGQPRDQWGDSGKL